MGKYDFDEIVPRRGTESVKWDLAEEEGVIPMWVADMDFRTAPAVLDALRRRVGHGVFGYTKMPQKYFDADPLIYKDNTYSIDFADLERRASDPDAKLLILCNPHNPSGRVWTRDELTRVGEICMENGVFVIADEIHCELTYPGHDYIPFASLSDRFLMNSVTCSSPSKAFNIAGLEIANILAADSSVRGRIKEAMRQSELDHINSFGPDALIAAYTEGEEWLAELCRYIYDNYLYLVSYISGHLPGYRVLPLEGTYLAWMDISRSGMKSDALAERILQDGKVMVNPGTMYGPGGEDFLRINLACPRKLLEEGLGRMCRTILGL